MKKVLVLITAMSVFASGAVLARPDQGGFNHHAQQNSQNCSRPGFHGGEMNGGFKGPTATATTVEAAKNLPDDSKVTLVGYIVQSLGGEDYLFKDDSGTITVEIDHKRWRGLSVSSADKVEIYGEVDKDRSTVDIDVKHITKVAP